MFYAEDGAKAVNWYDEELNKDLGEVLKTQDEEKRTELYDKILTRINDQAVTVPLYYPNRDYIYNNTIPDEPSISFTSCPRRAAMMLIKPGPQPTSKIRRGSGPRSLFNSFVQ